MKRTEDVTCCVVDSGGNYIALAQRLSKEYKKVYYTAPSWVSAYPKMHDALVGQGWDDIEAVDNPFDCYNYVDLWCFPDTYYGPFQNWLVDQGEKVWGCRSGEEMELQRDDLKEHMLKLGLPVQPYESIKGTTNLREFLKENENVYVKINKWRGLVETFHSKNYTLVKPKIDQIEHHLGAFSEEIQYVVEQPIDGVEVGYDGWTIDGKYPEYCLSGIEIKDKCYVGEWMEYKDIPTQITDFNVAMSDTFKGYGFRGFFSTEIRVADKPYMIDFTARTPCPPGELYHLMISNLGECIWAGANGELRVPTAAKKFGVELMINSDEAKHNFQPIYYPDKYADNIKLKKSCIIDAVRYVIPMSESEDVGAIVAIGDTLEEAIDEVLVISETIEGLGLQIRKDAVEGAVEELNKSRKL